jgi:uncharacterized membrane protein HdeD (DUF308 family)
MSPIDYLRWLTTPDRGRWKTMFMGLAIFAAAVGAAVLLQAPELLGTLLVLLGIAAWFVGACAMLGYLRWFFASELARARREKDKTV